MRLRYDKMLVPVGAAAGLAALLLTSACNVAVEGEQGNLRLTYVTGDLLGGQIVPIAVGSKLDVKVHPSENDRTLSVTGAETDDAEIIAVTDIQGQILTLAAASEGITGLSVDAEVSGLGSQSDSFELEAREAGQVSLSQACGFYKESEARRYLADAAVEIPFRLQTAEGDPLVGYGYYPISGATIDAEASTARHVALQTAAAVGTMTLESDLDDGSLELELVEEGAIATVTTYEDEEMSGLTLSAGTQGYLHPLLFDEDGALICQAHPELQVVSTTPEVCDAGLDHDPEEDIIGVLLVERAQTVIVTAKAEGQCEVSLTYPNARSGEGLQHTVAVEVTAASQQ